MNTQLILASAQVILMLCAVVMFFLSLKIIAGEMKKDFAGETEKTVKKSFMRSVKKSLKYMCGGFLFYICMKLCGNISVTGTSLGSAALKAAVDTAVSIGFVVLIPYVLMYWKLAAFKKASKKD